MFDSENLRFDESDALARVVQEDPGMNDFQTTGPMLLQVPALDVRTRNAVIAHTTAGCFDPTMTEKKALLAGRAVARLAIGAKRLGPRQAEACDTLVAQVLRARGNAARYMAAPGYAPSLPAQQESLSYAPAQVMPGYAPAQVMSQAASGLSPRQEGILVRIEQILTMILALLMRRAPGVSVDATSLSSQASHGALGGVSSAYQLPSASNGLVSWSPSAATANDYAPAPSAAPQLASGSRYAMVRT